MRVVANWIVGSACLLALSAGCSSAPVVEPGTDSGVHMDTGAFLDGARPDTGGIDANRPDTAVDANLPDTNIGPDADIDTNVPFDDAFFPGIDSGTPMDAVVPPVDGNGVDVGMLGCFPASCSGHQYACGNCLDDDGDGLVDSRDPDCLNQCDNSEDVYSIGIPGGDGATCMIDCYYDSDQGPGNDDCTWNYQCDPLSPGNDGNRNRCHYDSRVTCPATQSTTCHDICGPITPNGCDCFGCCEITPGSGDYVYLGSTPSPGHALCSEATLSDPESCRPCTPVGDCLNTCEHCELCFGRDTLPPDCFPPPPVDAAVPGNDAGNDATYPDGGHPDAYVVPNDAYVPPNDAYVPPRCPPGILACGLPGDPLCPPDLFCITGCCQLF